MEECLLTGNLRSFLLSNQRSCQKHSSNTWLTCFICAKDRNFCKDKQAVKCCVYCVSKGLDHICLVEEPLDFCGQTSSLQKANPEGTYWCRSVVWDGVASLFSYVKRMPEQSCEHDVWSVLLDPLLTVAFLMQPPGCQDWNWNWNILWSAKKKDNSHKLLRTQQKRLFFKHWQGVGWSYSLFHPLSLR